MKIVDPKVAIAMLNRTHDQIPPLRPDNIPPIISKPNEPMVSNSGDTNKAPQQTFASMPMNGGQFGGQPSGYPGEFAHEQVPQAMGKSFMQFHFCHVYQLIEIYSGFLFSTLTLF